MAAPPAVPPPAVSSELTLKSVGRCSKNEAAGWYAILSACGPGADVSGGPRGDGGALHVITSAWSNLMEEAEPEPTPRDVTLTARVQSNALHVADARPARLSPHSPVSYMTPVFTTTQSTISYFYIYNTSHSHITVFINKFKNSISYCSTPIVNDKNKKITVLLLY